MNKFWVGLKNKKITLSFSMLILAVVFVFFGDSSGLAEKIDQNNC